MVAAGTSSTGGYLERRGQLEGAVLDPTLAGGGIGRQQSKQEKGEKREVGVKGMRKSNTSQSGSFLSAETSSRAASLGCGDQGCASMLEVHQRSRLHGAAAGDRLELVGRGETILPCSSQNPR